MTITVAIIGPDGPTRRAAAYSIGSNPNLFVSVDTSTLNDFRGLYRETIPMVILLGTEHLAARGDGTAPFWRGIHWCRRRFPQAPITVWFDSADDKAPQDLHSAGVRGIVQTKDATDELWQKMIFAAFRGASLWSRPFDIQLEPEKNYSK